MGGNERVIRERDGERKRERESAKREGVKE